MFGTDPAGAALVTGASRGIGRVIALRLAEAGLDVAINYRRSKDEAEALASEIEALGRRAVALRADMASSEEAAELFPRAEAELGPIGVVVSNAGITRDALLIRMTDRDWLDTWCTDLAGPRALARVALAAMCERGGGRLINIGSV